MHEALFFPLVIYYYSPPSNRKYQSSLMNYFKKEFMILTEDNILGYCGKLKITKNMSKNSFLTYNWSTVNSQTLLIISDQNSVKKISAVKLCNFSLLGCLALISKHLFPIYYEWAKQIKLLLTVIFKKPSRESNFSKIFDKIGKKLKYIFLGILGPLII